MTAAGTVIDNTAQASYVDPLGAATSVDSNTDTITTVPSRTPSQISFLHYAPGSPGAVATDVTPALCSSSGTTGGPFGPAPPVTDLGGSPIDFGSPVDLVVGGAFHAGEPLFVRLIDPDQNLDAAAQDAVVLRLESTSLGDPEALTLFETSLDTGEFVGALMSGPPPPAVGDCVLSVGIGGRLAGAYVDPMDPGDTSSTEVLVDPFGRVFDSVTGALVDGATITLIDSLSGTPATVLGDDGVSSFPSTITSGGSVSDGGGTVYNFPAGGFRFPLVSAGQYELQVTPPPGYSHPAAVPDVALQTLPGAPWALSPGSRGQPFSVPVGPALEVDIPLDPVAGGGLLLTKTANKAAVQIGEFVQYALTLSNGATAASTGPLTLRDVLPPGFRYQGGSLRIADAGVPDPPVSGDGRTLQIPLAGLGPSGEVRVRYVARVGPGARSGLAVNRAVAQGASVTSNEAKAPVDVREEILSERAFLVGRVMVGACGDPVNDPHQGVAGVRLFLETGSYVVTDSEGRFHFAAVSSDTHVVQLDVDTLPQGYRPRQCPGNRFSGRSFSQFVEPQSGSLWRADFFVEKVGPPTASLHQQLFATRNGDGVDFRMELAAGEVGTRRTSATAILPEGLSFVEGSATIDGEPLNADAADGVVTFRIGDLEPEEEATIRFEAVARRDDQALLVTQTLLRGYTENGVTLQTPPAQTTLPDAGAASAESPVQRVEALEEDAGAAEPEALDEALDAAKTEASAEASPLRDVYGDTWLESAQPGNAWLYPAPGAMPPIPSVH
ncbi:MAG: hypothetical protein OEM05_08075, partial [Myxococcales bacterium]|nr:hypothetical protein [Myxococcales bacterium]